MSNIINLAATVNGKDFSEHVYIRSETLAERLIEKMKAKNKINLSHWIDITNDPAYQ